MLKSVQIGKQTSNEIFRLKIHQNVDKLFLSKKLFKL